MGADPGEVLAALDAILDGPDAPLTDWTAASLDALIDHIVVTYHQPMAAELIRLKVMAAKVLRASSS